MRSGIVCCRMPAAAGAEYGPAETSIPGVPGKKPAFGTSRSKGIFQPRGKAIMKNMPRLSKSGVKYIDYSWGIFSGCRNLQVGICKVKACWAKSLSQRFTDIFPNGFEPTFYPEALLSPSHLKKQSIISVGWMGDIIGYCKSESEKSLVYQTILQNPQHKFLFLTKNPENLKSWSPFPDNAYPGVSVTDSSNYIEDNETVLSRWRGNNLPRRLPGDSSAARAGRNSYYWSGMAKLSSWVGRFR